VFRPIDNQITLAADTMRNTAAVARQGETAQSFNAIQSKAQAEHDAQSVVKTDKSAQLQTNRDGGEGGAQQYESSERERKSKENAAILNSDFLIAFDPNGQSSIDIEI
jgi:hypothetical protein